MRLSPRSAEEAAKHVLTVLRAVAALPPGRYLLQHAPFSSDVFVLRAIPPDVAARHTLIAYAPAGLVVPDAVAKAVCRGLAGQEEEGMWRTSGQNIADGREGRSQGLSEAKGKAKITLILLVSVRPLPAATGREACVPRQRPYTFFLLQTPCM